jgi:dihydrofolate synthase/folylpolyglutamate synthase
VVGFQSDPGARAVIEARATEIGATLIRFGYDFTVDQDHGPKFYHDRFGSLEMPVAAESFQLGNWQLATAMLRHQSVVCRYDPARANEKFYWPARFQVLRGPLVEGLTFPVMLDGAHNAQGATLLANRHVFERFREGRGHVVMAGILANRDPETILAPFAGMVERFIALPIPGHDHHDPVELAATADRLFGRSDSIAASTIAEGFATLQAMNPATDTIVLGSLYLAGEVLRLNGELPQ